MGKMIVNGQVVEVRETIPTAASLKQQVGATRTDWVVAAMPSGEVVKVSDADLVPVLAENVSIVPAYEYGA